VDDHDRDDQVSDDGPLGGERRSLLSRRRFLLLGGAALAGLIGAWRLERIPHPRSSPAPSSTLARTPGSVESFPVLSVEGGPPGLAADGWVLTVDGLVGTPLRLDRTAWLALPRAEETIDLHCIEGWSMPDLHWEGVRVMDLLQRVSPRPEGRFVSFHAYGGRYANSLTLEEALAPQAILADRLNGAPLPAAHGGPLRLMVPTQLGNKNVKWVARVEVAAEPHNLP
jgi:DMSO/TMAO reductase YedYZ molybdopterin-dependent catalytic subunit